MSFPSHLSKNLRRRLGEDAGGDLVTWLEEMRAEHVERLARIEAMEARLLQRMDDRFTKVDGQFAEVGERLAKVDERLAKVDERLAKVDDRFAKVDERLATLQVGIADSKAELMKWMLVFWVGAVGAIAALAGVLRV